MKAIVTVENNFEMNGLTVSCETLVGLRHALTMVEDYAHPCYAKIELFASHDLFASHSFLYHFNGGEVNENTLENYLCGCSHDRYLLIEKCDGISNLVGEFDSHAQAYGGAVDLATELMGSYLNIDNVKCTIESRLNHLYLDVGDDIQWVWEIAYCEATSIPEKELEEFLGSVEYTE